MTLFWQFADSRNLNKIPNKPGVYIIGTKNINNSYDVKYIGQTSDLNDRSYTHFSEYETNFGLKNHISWNRHQMGVFWAEVSYQNDRNGIELFLYNNYKPEFNQIKPPALWPIECNLP